MAILKANEAFINFQNISKTLVPQRDLSQVLYSVSNSGRIWP